MWDYAQSLQIPLYLFQELWAKQMLSLLTWLQNSFIPAKEKEEEEGFPVGNKKLIFGFHFLRGGKGEGVAFLTHADQLRNWLSYVTGPTSQVGKLRCAWACSPVPCVPSRTVALHPRPSAAASPQKEEPSVHLSYADKPQMSSSGERYCRASIKRLVTTDRSMPIT